MTSIKDNYLMKKIIICNDIDKKNKSNTNVNLAINTEKIVKPHLNIKEEINKRLNENNKNISDIEKNIIKRINNPYKGIIKDFDYNREIKEKDITIYKVNLEDKNIDKFKTKLTTYNSNKKNEDDDIKNIYSLDKKNIHKKEFDYNHKYKYCSKIDSGDDNIRIDSIEFYKKEQEKQENNKKKIDSVLNDLINIGAISDDLNSIDYNKINPDELEKTLRNTFGNDEYNKLLAETLKTLK